MFFSRKKQQNQRQMQATALTKNLNENLEMLKSEFNYPKNKDFYIKEIFIASLQKKGYLLYINGTVDVKSMEQLVIRPLINSQIKDKNEDDYPFLLHHVLTTVSGEEVQAISSIVNDLLSGHTIIIIEGEASALTISTEGFETRQIEKPANETVIKGPKESFTESASKNLSLIRKQLKNKDLVTEFVQVGKTDKQKVSLMYVQSIADDDLVNRVKKRVEEIEADAIPELSFIEQHIEERPYSLVPSCLMTERPDRAASFLREGHVIILYGPSPYALVTPITFWSLFHTGEDYYERWAYGNFIRLIRLLAVMVALLTPAIYIAATNFHPEMLPTDLLLAISATREMVPFPAILEVLIMELTFELLREAGIRIPTAIGPTIGIVGALILGQAAVDANVISPIMVIVVAITGLASFAIPEIGFSYIIRILRFGFLIAAAVVGFYGIALFMVVCLAYLASINTFGVAFLSPLAPHYPSSKDLIIRPPVWKLWLRPQNIQPKKRNRSNKPTS
ncbi:spore germination protein [Lottiidibacillus patelloidae]|uniref:Spore germination protein n=1 Tax=Lottiidibacillus patelloidae TaxID=2670334 RepID=A0A263BWG5_9BACI|nr:spore germination protein [Lottiidibacillus patelloidae]OZM58079.1 spore germination protein [Lottiidibacillus patelloidae]